jgi:hypothetical protein
MQGEHIRVLKGGRWLHAIDCGDETVLQLVESAPPPRVRRAYRPEFVAGAEAVEVVTHRERTFPAKEVVRRGYSRASDPALAVMFQDSEAFAEWCKTGRIPGANHAVEVLPADQTIHTQPRRAAARKPAKAKARAAAPQRRAVVAKARPAPKRNTASRSAKPAPKRSAKPTSKRIATAAAKRTPARTSGKRTAAKPARGTNVRARRR